MLECPLCRVEWCVLSKLCVECEEIRHLISIYGRDNIKNILTTNLVRPQEKLDELFKKNDGYKNVSTSEISITKSSLRKLKEKDIVEEVSK